MSRATPMGASASYQRIQRLREVVWGDFMERLPVVWNTRALALHAIQGLRPATTV